MRRALLGAALFAVLLAIGGLIFVYSGIYNVAATRPHFDVVYWLLDTTKRRSVERHARDIAVIEGLDEAALAFRGAGNYEAACASCHGAPGRRRDTLGDALNPEAPDLARSAKRWNAAELFWIVKFGVKYTGMPGWTTTHRDDEIWALVSFVRRLPRMSPGEYAAWTGADIDRGATRALEGVAELAAADCARCHKPDGAGFGEVPSLAGQDRDYLIDTLKRYASGTRHSGIMGPVARALPDEDIRGLAEYYAGLYAGPLNHEAKGQMIQEGGVISARGLPELGIRACADCHPTGGGRRAEAQVILAQQRPAYIALQLRLWRAGVRTEPPMREIAARLTDRQIEALSAYFASLPRRP